jgi:hypothetical protein
MAKAKIVLLDNGPVTFNGRGYSLKRGETRTVTNASDILYFQAQHGIGVEILEALPKATKVAASVSKAGAVSAPEPEPEDDEPVTGAVTAEDLTKLTKGALLQYNIEEKIGAKVDGNMSKSAIIAAILDAKNGESESEDEDEGDGETEED